jgi:acetyl esterase/lipase
LVPSLSKGQGERLILHWAGAINNVLRLFLKRRWFVPALLLLTALAAGAVVLWRTHFDDAAHEQPPLPVGVVFKKGLAYCEAGGQTLKLDWAEPQSRAAHRPAVVLIHGGAWMFGQRKELRALQFMLAQEGFVAVSVDYRLAPKATFPQPLHDVQCAVRWLRMQATAHAIDPNRISAWGHSAGAHWAALLAVTANRADLQGTGQVIAAAGSATAMTNNATNTTDSHVHSVIAHSGIYDLVAAQDPNQNVFPDARRGAVAMAGGDSVDALRRASVLDYAHPQASPVLVLHGESDAVAPLSQALLLYDALKAQGATSQLLTVPGAGHNDLGPQASRVLAEAVAFLKQAEPAVKR